MICFSMDFSIVLSLLRPPFHTVAAAEAMSASFHLMVPLRKQGGTKQGFLKVRMIRVILANIKEASYRTYTPPKTNGWRAPK